MPADAHKLKYELCKDFFAHGISDKFSFPDWYIRGMYTAIYHLTAWHYARRGETDLTEKALADKYAPGGELQAYASEFFFFERCRTQSLYPSLRLTSREVNAADAYFTKIEAALL
ncbi:MAG: hypothetical protein LBR85_05680 [Oscillospiraceae bacterium]|jgi:hypothetical protein|nr:hypothetical protein [Oscillospiraceae bacterium]